MLWFSRNKRRRENNNYWKRGSDASAIMIAKIFQAERCVIYTDVEGVYTTDQIN